MKNLKSKKKRPVAKKKKVHEIKTDYLHSLYSKKYLKIVPAAVKKLRAFKKKHNFEAIAFTGSSGAGLAYPLSYLLKVPLIHVRKKNSSPNYRKVIEGTVSADSYIIVDDFISSGQTVKRILREIAKHLGSSVKPIAIFLYDADFYYGKKWDGIPIIKVKVK